MTQQETSETYPAASDAGTGRKLLLTGFLAGLTILLLVLALIKLAPSDRPELTDAALPAFAVPLLEDGTLQDNSFLDQAALLSDDSGFKIVNFFASWCLPCEAEHPLLSRLSQYAPVYGIGYMDEPAPLAAFLGRLGNPYRTVGVDQAGETGAVWAIKGLPTTFVIGPDGTILYRLDAPLTPDKIKTIISYLSP